jgi:hypothetical protein
LTASDLIDLIVEDIGLWIGLSSVFILATSEILSPNYGKIDIPFDLRNLRRIALAFGAVFLIIAAAKVTVFLLPI